MNKTVKIILSILAILLISGAIFWSVKNRNERKQREEVTTQNNSQQNQSEQKQEPKKETLEDLINSIEEIKLPEVDTSRWQVYKNEKYGFEMKIPKDWYVESTEDGLLCLKSKTRVFYFEGEKNVCGISLDVKYSDKYFKNENEFVILVKKMQEQGIISKIGYIFINSEKNLYFNWSNAEVIAIIHNGNIWNMVIQGADNSINPVFSGISQTLHLTK